MTDQTRAAGPLLQTMKVLNPRTPFCVFREFDNKEWWYTGITVPARPVYISWYFIRVNVLDKFVMTVFDAENGVAPATHFTGTCWLHRQGAGDDVGLVGGGRNWKVSYRPTREDVWKLDLHTPDLVANVDISLTPDSFTKFDNEFKYRYAIIHYFQSQADGTITLAGGKRYELSKGLVYQDHCYGRVPRRTGWHWIAVQNEQVALTSLMNYGPYGQRFSQVRLAPKPGPGNAPTWVRLDQNVSFERASRDDVMGTWRVTSPDMELEVTPRQKVDDRTRVPPFVNLEHTELFVEAKGQIRVDGRWSDTNLLRGVMEQHHGRW